MSLDLQGVRENLSSIGQHPLLLKPCFLEIDVSRKQATDVDVLGGFPNLMYVNLCDNNITDISVLGEMTALTELKARNNKLSGSCLDFAPSKCSEESPNSNGHKALGSTLISADVSDNNYSSLEGIDARHPFLEFLLVSNNKISSITSLSNMTFLKVLDLSHNDIRHLNGIDSCSSLQELNVSGNAIISLEELPKLSKLSYVNLANNRIVTLAPLKNCPTLQSIDVRDNSIGFIRQVEMLGDLGLLEMLALEGNPASFKAFYRLRVVYKLPRLSQLDKTPICAEEKIRAHNLYESAVMGDLEMRKSVFKEQFSSDSFVLRTPSFEDEEVGLSDGDIAFGMTSEQLQEHEEEHKRFVKSEAKLMAQSIVGLATASPEKKDASE